MGTARALARLLRAQRLPAPRPHHHGSLAPAASLASGTVARPELPSHLNAQLLSTHSYQESPQDGHTPRGGSALNSGIWLPGRSCWPAAASAAALTAVGGSGHATAALGQEQRLAYPAASASHRFHSSSPQTHPLTGDVGGNIQAGEGRDEGVAQQGAGDAEALSPPVACGSSPVHAESLAGAAGDSSELRDWGPSASLAHCQGPEDLTHQGAGEGASMLAQSYAAVTDNVSASLDACHSLIGLPWWVSIAASTVALRLLLLPLTVQQMKVAAQLSLLRPKLLPWFPAPGSGASWRETRRRYNKRLKELGAPSSGWLFAAPLVQVPLFLAWVVSLRHMATTGHPGFDTGGALWFEDLTAVAAGPLAWILPSTIALTFLVSIQIAFAPPPMPAVPGKAGPRPSFLSRRHLPLFFAVSHTLHPWPSHSDAFLSYLGGPQDMLYSFWLELLSVPTFFTCLYYVPQAVHMYWLTNNLFTIAQGLAARSDLVRAAMGIPTYKEMRDAAAAAMREKAAAAALAAPQRGAGAAATGGAKSGEALGLGEVAAAGVPTGNLSVAPESVIPDSAQQGLSVTAPGQLAHTDPEVVSLLEVASRLKAQGNAQGSLGALMRAKDVDPDNPSVWLGLGHALFDLKNFPAAAAAFTKAAAMAPEGNVAVQLIAWRGSGFAFFNQGELEKAEEFLQKAASIQLTGTELGQDALHRRWHGSAMVALASLLSRKKRHADALVWLQRAAIYDPSIQESMIVPLEEQLTTASGAPDGSKPKS